MASGEDGPEGHRVLHHHLVQAGRAERAEGQHPLDEAVAEERPEHGCAEHHAAAVGDVSSGRLQFAIAAFTAGWVILPAWTLSPSARCGSAASAAATPWPAIFIT